MRRHTSACDSVEVRLSCVIVDDNLDFLEAARRLLGGQGIEVVAVATSGAEGIRQVAASRPDVVLVDVNLGEESGGDLARRIADSSDTSSTRIVLISTLTEADVVAMLPEGATIPFVAKSDLSASAIRAAIGLPP